jgi:hypothetical protein
MKFSLLSSETYLNIVKYWFVIALFPLSTFSIFLGIQITKEILYQYESKAIVIN